MSPRGRSSCWCDGKDILAKRNLLFALAIVTPFGFIATEAGWTVTEVGRQPWVVQGVLRTADAVTPMPGVAVPMTLFTILYIVLAAIVVVLMQSLVRRDAMSGELAIGLPEIVAGAIVLALTGYALTGGADYGGGVWDLLARGPRREAQRRLIAESIGPIWEANHVWLIVAVVVLFTGFPAAFGVLGTVLHVPITILLIGIVLRGSAFVFRSYGRAEHRIVERWGLVFSIASVVTPLCFGIVIGAISSGAVGQASARAATGAGRSPRSTSSHGWRFTR